MEVYVFDDKEPVEAGYLGRGHVPLNQLAEGQPVEGVFGLKTVCNKRLVNIFTINFLHIIP